MWPGPHFIYGGVLMEIADIVLLYADVVRIALPFTFIFWIGERVTSSILTAAFGGRLSF